MSSVTTHRLCSTVITFPGSYHFGFNTGFNVAESTNFAVPEWIPLGEAANTCMCHPHSVRIQMKRLKSLLDTYDKDMWYRESMGLPKLTYSNWAKHEAKRTKKERASHGKAADNESDSENWPQLSLTLNKSIAIEITRESATPSKKGKRKRDEINEWRLAKRVRPGLFVPNAPVICMVECEDDAESKYEFFSATVVDVVDGHVKVHLNGLGRKDDMWFEQDSEYLFLDGGRTDPPAASKQ